MAPGARCYGPFFCLAGRIQEPPRGQPGLSQLVLSGRPSKVFRNARSWLTAAASLLFARRRGGRRRPRYGIVRPARIRTRPSVPRAPIAGHPSEVARAGLDRPDVGLIRAPSMSRRARSERGRRARRSPARRPRAGRRGRQGTRRACAPVRRGLAASRVTRSATPARRRRPPRGVARRVPVGSPGASRSFIGGRSWRVAVPSPHVESRGLWFASSTRKQGGRRRAPLAGDADSQPDCPKRGERVPGRLGGEATCSIRRT